MRSQVRDFVRYREVFAESKMLGGLQHALAGLVRSARYLTNPAPGFDPGACVLFYFGTGGLLFACGCGSPEFEHRFPTTGW